MPTKPPSEIKGGPGCTFPAKPVAFAAYVLVGLLTFGHVFNANYAEPVQDCGAKPDVVEQPASWDKWYWCEHPRYISTTEGAAPVAFAAGIAWPIYWSGHLAIKVTK